MRSTSIIVKSLQVRNIKLLGIDVYRVQLFTERCTLPQYYAGQYLEIVLANEDRLAFSIASAPVSNQKELELHIQKVQGKESSEKLFEELKRGDVTVRMPQGGCYLEKVTSTPLVLIAAGTGFAQMKSIIEYSLMFRCGQDIYLYWGARSPEGFYLPLLPVEWANKGLHYFPILNDASNSEDWCGRSGLLYSAVLTDKEKFIGAEVYISGSPKMVYETTDGLLDGGFKESSIYSDVFEYAPR